MPIGLADSTQIIIAGKNLIPIKTAILGTPIVKINIRKAINPYSKISNEVQEDYKLVYFLIWLSIVYQHFPKINLFYKTKNYPAFLIYTIKTLLYFIKKII